MKQHLTLATENLKEMAMEGVFINNGYAKLSIEEIRRRSGKRANK